MTVLVCTAILAAVLVYVIYLLDNINYKITRTGRHIMSETQDAIDAVSAQLGKAKDEIVTEINNLEAQVAAGEAPDLTALKAAAQALDDVVPDAPVDAPVDEAPAE